MKHLLAGVCLGGATVAGLSGCAIGQPAFDPASTLFLTWSGNPCTTMTVQWLEAGDLPEAVSGSATAADVAFRLPKLDGVTIDGDKTDWGIHGTRLDYLARPDGGWPDPTGFSATAKLAWSDAGLLALVRVVDDEATEAEHDDELWTADGVELFLANRYDGETSVQVIVAPGMDEERPTLRTQVMDRRGGDKPEPVRVDAASSKTDDGYVVELLLHWNDVVDAEPGATPAVQLIVNDKDGPFDREQLAWFPGVDTYADLRQTQRVMLGISKTDNDDTVRAMVMARVAGESDERHDKIKPGTVLLDFGGEPRLIGETVTVRSGGFELAEVKLDRVMGFAGRVVPLPPPPPDEGGASQRWSAVTVELDDRVVARAKLDDAVWRVPGVSKAALVAAVDGNDNVVHEATSVAKPFGDTGLFVQRLDFVGLQPGTTYEAVIDGTDQAFRFRTAPVRLDAPLVFAEGGDVGTEDEYVVPLHRHAAAWAPLFGLVGGDLAYGNGTDEKAWVEYLQLWHKHMQSRSDTDQAPRLIPMLVTIGNHEVPGGFAKRRHDAPFYYALFDGLYDTRNYATLDFGEPAYLSLILLDSGHTSRVRGWQTDWLAEALPPRESVPHLFAAYHVPAYPSHRTVNDGPRGAVRRAVRVNWVPLFERHGVDAVFEHDDHTYKRTRLRDGKIVPDGTPRSVLYLGDGAWGKGGRPVRERDYLEVAEAKRHVIRVEIRPDGSQHFRAVDVRGETIDTASNPPR